MFTADDRRSKGPSPSDIFDPWRGWKPDWTGKTASPQDYQEKHSPTEQVSVRLTSDRNLHKSQRRIVDARLWDAMTGEQQGAAIEIALAFDMMGRGMGYVLSNWQRIPGCRSASNVSDAHTRLINAYVDWAKKCAAQKISHAMAIDILCFGFSCRMIDRDRRVRAGAARDNLLRGLALYAELQGWTRG